MSKVNEEVLDTAEELKQEDTQATSGEEVKDSNAETTATKETPNKETIELTQDEINEIIQKRIERERKKFADYDELKRKADEYEEQVRQAKRERMTEVERLEADLKERDAALEEYQNKAEQARKEAEALRIRTEFDRKAREAGVKYVDDAYRLLVEGNEAVKIDGHDVVGIDEVLKNIAEEKPFLMSPPQTIGRPLASKELPKKSDADLLREAEARARREGTPEARIEYANLKRKLGL